MKNSFQPSIIRQAVDDCGGIQVVADHLKRCPRAVSNWCDGSIELPTWAAASLEILSKGRWTRQQLMPELYGPLKPLRFYVEKRRVA